MVLLGASVKEKDRNKKNDSKNAKLVHSGDITCSARTRRSTSVSFMVWMAGEARLFTFLLSAGAFLCLPILAF
jgi:hypothetical protein